jgi:predicted RecA/RadA family phage recombinase
MAQADFWHGSPLMMDYTPGSAVAAGDVVVIGEIPCIAHTAIAANEVGAVAVGGGVYRVTTDGTTDTAGDKIYWNDAANKVTTTATGNKVFGYTSPDQGATVDNDLIFVHHNPDA